MARVTIPVTDVEPQKATLTTSLTGDDNDLKFTARKGGSWGNDIQVAYIDPSANSQSLSVDVDGFLITVNLATNASGTITSTASEVKAKIAASLDAAKLVDVALAGSDDGTGVLTAMSATSLTGGAYATDQPDQVTADATNNHVVTGNDGRVVVEVISSEASSSRTVTIHYAPLAGPGVTTDPEVVTVTAGDTFLLGPFPPSVFNQNSDGDVWLDPSVATTLKFRAYRVTQLR